MDTRPRKSQRKTSPPAPSVASTIGDLGVAGLTMGQQLVYRPAKRRNTSPDEPRTVTKKAKAEAPRIPNRLDEWPKYDEKLHGVATENNPFRVNMAQKFAAESTFFVSGPKTQHIVRPIQGRICLRMSSAVASSLRWNFPRIVQKDYDHLVGLATKRFLEAARKEKTCSSEVERQVTKIFNAASKNLKEEAASVMKDVYSLMQCVPSTITNELEANSDGSLTAKKSIILNSLEKARNDLLERIHTSHTRHEAYRKEFDEGISVLHCDVIEHDDVNEVSARLWDLTAVGRLFDMQTTLPTLKDVQHLPVPQHEIDELKAADKQKNTSSVMEKLEAAAQEKSETAKETSQEGSEAEEYYEYDESWDRPVNDDDPIGDEGDDLDDPVEDYIY